MNTFARAARRPSRLAPALAGKIMTPEHGRFDAARRAWNLAIDQDPAAVVFPESAQDVAAAVLFAAEWGQRLAPRQRDAGPPRLDRWATRFCSRPSGCAVSRSTRSGASPGSRLACWRVRWSAPRRGTGSLR